MNDPAQTLRLTVMDDHFRAFLREGSGTVQSVFSRALNIRCAAGLVSVVCGDWPAPYSANAACAETTAADAASAVAAAATAATVTSTVANAVNATNAASTADVPDAANAPFAGVAVGDAVSLGVGGMIAVGESVRLDSSRAKLFTAAFKRHGGCPDPAGGLAAFVGYCRNERFDGGCADFFRRHFLGLAEETADRLAAELSRRLADFSGAVEKREDCAEALWGIVGAGPGLTPSGDDFICGFLFALHNAGTPAAEDMFARVARILSSRALPTTEVSAQMLRASLDGESAAVFRELLEAFCGSRDMRDVMPKVRRVGHSSGMDFAVGMAAAFQALAEFPLFPMKT